MVETVKEVKVERTDETYKLANPECWSLGEYYPAFNKAPFVARLKPSQTKPYECEFLKVDKGPKSRYNKKRFVAFCNPAKQFADGDILMIRSYWWGGICRFFTVKVENETMTIKEITRDDAIKALKNRANA